MITGLLLATTPENARARAAIRDRALVIARALGAGVERRVAVVAGPDGLAAALRQEGYEVVCCPQPKAGLPHGVRVTAGASGWLVAPIDAPPFAAAVACAIAARLRAGALLAAPDCEPAPPYPLGFGRALAPPVATLKDSSRLDTLLDAYRDLVVRIPCPEGYGATQATNNAPARMPDTTPRC